MRVRTVKFKGGMVIVYAQGLPLATLQFIDDSVVIDNEYTCCTLSIAEASTMDIKVLETQVLNLIKLWDIRESLSNPEKEMVQLLIDTIKGLIV